jgi:predicted metal-dependent peptidase
VIRAPSEADQDLKRQVLASLAQDRARMIIFMPFVGSLAINLDLVPVVDDRVPTAAVDGERIFFSCRFYQQLTQAERIFVLGHEVWHCALMHLLRRQERDPWTWNMAIDHEVNNVLLEEMNEHQSGYAPPKGIIHYREYGTRSAEEVYDLLVTKLRRQRKSRSKGKDSGSGTSGSEAGSAGASDQQPPSAPPTPPSQQSGWKRMKDRVKSWLGKPPPTPPSQAQPPTLGDDPREERGRLADSHLDQMPETGEGMTIDPDFQPRVDPRAVRQWPGRVISAAQQYERTRGNLPGSIGQVVDAYRHPQVPWREQLSQFATTVVGGSHSEWLPPNRRYVHRGLYLPGNQTPTIRLAVAVDTSGSCVDDARDFLTELVGIIDVFQHYELIVYMIDAAVASRQVFTADEPLEPKRLVFAGGGGTDFRPFFDAIADEPVKPACLIYLTDGEGEAPAEDPGIPTLWVISRDGKAPAPWGIRLPLFDRERSAAGKALQESESIGSPP